MKLKLFCLHHQYQHYCTTFEKKSIIDLLVVHQFRKQKDIALDWAI